MRILKRLQSYCSLFVIRAMLICCVCAPAMVQAQLPGGVYTIDNRLPTSGKNYSSFNAAVIAMLNGITGSVTFNVAAGSGPYNEQVFLDDQIGSSATKLVTFNCNGVTLRFLSTNNLARAGIKISNADYIIFDNLKIEALATTSTEFGWGFHLSNDADHNIIRNCTITVNNNTDVPQNNEGIIINGSDDVATTQGNSNCDSNQIINNTISGGYTGVTMSSNPSSGQAVLMKDNQVLNNKISGYWNAGIYLLYNDGAVLQGNDISRGPIVVPIQYDVTGILMYEGNINTRIIGNRIHNLVNNDPASSSNIDGINIGSLATPNAPNIIANNLIYDFKSAGPQYGIKVTGSYINVYHNTISLENKAYVGTGITGGIYSEVLAGLNVMNNIITVSRTTSGSNYGFYLKNTVTAFNCDRNLYYISGSTGTNAVGRVGSNSQITLANWQTRTGKDLLSVNSDPIYKDANNFILEPTDKTIDNLGQYVGIQNDFAGAIRNNDHPDIGAYEFLTPKCTGAAVGGTTTMLPGSPICEGSPMAMNLSGNSFGLEQTYQWQSSSTINGTYANVGTVLAHPATNITAVGTLYYRVVVTCNTQVDYSVPIQVTVTPSLPAATYTINSAQATGGTNFQTFNDALNAIRCGIRGPVVFNVVDNGTPYREQLNITNINGTSATNTVTFKGNGVTLALATGTSTERAVVKFNGAAYFIFDGLKVNPEATTTGYGIGFQFINGAHNNTIKSCTITMSTSSGLTDLLGICISPSATNYVNTSAGSFCDSNIVTGNTIIGGQYAITCTSHQDYPTDGNVFTNNIIKDVRQYGIYLASARNCLVEGNDISRPTRTLNFPSSGTAFNMVFIAGINNNLRISKNKLHDPWGAAKTNTNQVNGIFMSATGGVQTAPVIVSNNLMYNFQSSGNQNGVLHLGGDNVIYYHNTISLEDVTGTSSSSTTTRAFNGSSQVAGLVLKNNIFVVRRGGTGIKYALYLNSTTTYTSDYNNLYNGSTAGTKNYLGQAKGIDISTKADWLANALCDSNSIYVHPNWANAATGDFTPTEITLDNKGTPVGITTDINNKTRRVTKPDIGAIEFKVCLLLGPGPNARVDNETTTSVRFAWDAVTNATGYVVSTDGVNYVQPSSGTTGLTHTVTGLIPGSDVKLYVAALGTADDCDSAKANVTGHALCAILGAAPIAKVDTATVAIVQFSWTATPNAAGYKVSTDGINFVTPSSGATGLTHTITAGLVPNSDISLTVQAQGLSELCPKQTSQQVKAHIPGIKYFVPNTFTPNRNGRNDYFTVQSYAISTMHLMIFNQWGEKIFETSSQKPGWDGTHNGKPAPVGVYVYVLSMTMQDGTTVNKKGTINLIR